MGQTYTAVELQTMAYVVAAEAKVGNYAGMAAVANVVRNRMDSGLYSSDPYTVITDTVEFSGARAADLDRARRDNPVGSANYLVAIDIVKGVMLSPKRPVDPTGGALFYHAMSYTPKGSDASWWSKITTKYGTVDIGGNLFFLRAPQEATGNDAALAAMELGSGVLSPDLSRGLPSAARAASPGYPATRVDGQYTGSFAPLSFTAEKPPVPATRAPKEMRQVASHSDWVVELQSEEAGTRTLPVQPELIQLLTAVGSETGVHFEITSGGQDETTGYPDGASTRHDHGGAGDMRGYTLNADGSKHPLSIANAEDQKVWARVIELAVSGGATGVGAGMDYMGEWVVHIGFQGEDRLDANGKVLKYGSDYEGMWGGAPWIAAAYERGNNAETPFDVAGVLGKLAGDKAIRRAAAGAGALGYGAKIDAMVDAHRNPPGPANLLRTGLPVDEALSIAPSLADAATWATSAKPDVMFDPARGAFITKEQYLRERGIVTDADGNVGIGPDPAFGPPTNIGLSAIDFAMAEARRLSPTPYNPIVAGRPINAPGGLPPVPYAPVVAGRPGVPGGLPAVAPNRAAPDHPANAYPGFTPPLEGQALYDARVAAGQADPNALIDVNGMLNALGDWIGVDEANANYAKRHPAPPKPKPPSSGWGYPPHYTPWSLANQEGKTDRARPNEPLVAGRPIGDPGMLPGYQPMVAGRDEVAGALPAAPNVPLVAGRPDLPEGTGPGALPAGPDLPRKRPAQSGDIPDRPKPEYVSINGKTYVVGEVYPDTSGENIFEVVISKDGVGKFIQVKPTLAEEGQAPGTIVGGIVRDIADDVGSELIPAAEAALGDNGAAIEKILKDFGSPGIQSTAALEQSLAERRTTPFTAVEQSSAAIQSMLAAKPIARRVGEKYVPLVAGRPVGAPGALPSSTDPVTTSGSWGELRDRFGVPGAIRTNSQAGNVALPPGVVPNSVKTPSQRIDDAVQTHRSYDVVDYMIDNLASRVVTPKGSPIIAAPAFGLAGSSADRPSNIVQKAITKAMVEQVHTTVKNTPTVAPAWTTPSQPVAQKVGGTGMSGNPANYNPPPAVKIPTPVMKTITIAETKKVISYVPVAGTIVSNIKQAASPTPVVKLAAPGAGLTAAQRTAMTDLKGTGAPASKLASAALGKGAIPPVPVAPDIQPKLKKVVTNVTTYRNITVPAGPVHRRGKVFDPNANAVIEERVAPSQQLVRKNGFVYTQGADGSLTPTAAAAAAMKRQALTGGDGMDRSAAGEGGPIGAQSQDMSRHRWAPAFSGKETPEQRAQIQAQFNATHDAAGRELPKVSDQMRHP